MKDVRGGSNKVERNIKYDHPCVPNTNRLSLFLILQARTFLHRRKPYTMIKHRELPREYYCYKIIYCLDNYTTKR